MVKKSIQRAVVAITAVIGVSAAYCAFASGFLIAEKYTVVDGGTLDNSLPYFISADGGVLSAGSSGSLSNGRVKSGGTRRVGLKLFNVIPVKTVSVSVVSSPRVVPSGRCIGVKLYCDGLITVGVTDFEAEDGGRVSPASDAGIRAGDIIKAVNGKKITSIAQFTNLIDSLDGVCTLTVRRESDTVALKAVPRACSDGHRRIGVWVRDSIAGIGTMTFTEDNGSRFAALGHGISDSDTEVLLPLERGQVYSASILGITKGRRGAPGEIIGALAEDEQLGVCTKNLETGIYGTLSATAQGAAMDIAPSSQVQRGKAVVMCSVNDEAPAAYTIEIVNINKFARGGTKCMVIEVTDPRLLEKTGGIVQGMSGSPIVQNGRLVGAVTHVFVNNPQKGYAIFAETMLNELGS